MLVFIEDEVEAEFLFTADEEIGLVGAKSLNIPLLSDYMLNLDTEEAGEVYIGCAGGFDLSATKYIDTIVVDSKTYLVKVDGLPGGHSGVDIDKNIPSATKLLAEELVKHDIKLLHVEGGE